MVVLSAEAVGYFDRFSLYNSPYPAHRHGHAVDLYPPSGAECAPSPVAGTVVETRASRAPSRPGAEDLDYLIVVDTGEYLARMLHVEPVVREGTEIDVGDELGRLVDSGYFAPWVGPHVHLGFRQPGTNAVRATGSEPLRVAVPVRPIPWDGTGTVVNRAATYVDLDAPGHPDPGEWYGGLATDTEGLAIDGGLPHYDGGGVFPDSDGSVSLLGTTVGKASARDLAWADVTVRLDGEPVTGLSLVCGRVDTSVRVVCPDRSVPVGTSVTVSLTAP
jgi:hypothetical protein